LWWENYQKIKFKIYPNFFFARNVVLKNRSQVGLGLDDRHPEDALALLRHGGDQAGAESGLLEPI
jgi:hypothetical protein